MDEQQDTIDNNPTIEVKKDWRRDNLATRIDLRMPNEVYDRVIEIAIASGEKINPKTSQVRVTATLNKLIEIGIRYYPDDNPITPVNVGQLSDSIGLEEKYQELSDKYRELESTISDINLIVLELTQDIIRLKSINIEETIKTYIEKATKPIDESINELETYTRSQFAAVREEFKQPLTVAQTQQEEVVTSFDINPLMGSNLKRDT
jgi:ribosomal protein L14E/L6E/L27E